MSASDVKLEVPAGAAASTADTMGVPGSFADLTLLNTKGIRVTVRNLTYAVQSFRDKKETAVLLNDVSSMFNPGEMTALLGPSGSGKTTFLDLISGRKTVGEIDGVIHFGGKATSTRFLRRHTGYVEQFDTLIPALTVYEMLMYTAELKRPLEESAESKEAACEKLLEELGLAAADSASAWTFASVHFLSKCATHPSPLSWSIFGTNGAGTSRFSSFAQLIFEKNLCFFTSSVPFLDVESFFRFTSLPKRKFGSFMVKF